MSSLGKRQRPSRTPPPIPPAKRRPSRSAPQPPSLLKQVPNYNIQETSDSESWTKDLRLQDFNFLPFFESKVKDLPHSIFLGESKFGHVVVIIIHPTKQEFATASAKKSRKKGPLKHKSVKTDEEETDDDEISIDVLIRGIPGDIFFSFPANGLKQAFKPRQLIQKFQEHVKEYEDVNFHHVKDPAIVDDICSFEKQLLQTKYKFGLLLRLNDENDEDSLFSTSGVTPDFEEFVSALGEKKKLKGWKDYSGGLDTKDDLDCKESVYAKWNSFEIMWHICPYMNLSTTNKQQVERKRHIGNDVCIVIFDEGHTPIDPSILTSRFIHVIMVVRKRHDLSIEKVFYEVAVASKEGTGEHHPLLPKSRIFEKSPQLKDFIYTKMINAERASYLTVAFAKAITKTRQGLLDALIWQKYWNN